jgi:hypothetical protein
VQFPLSPLRIEIALSKWHKAKQLALLFGQIFTVYIINPTVACIQSTLNNAPVVESG